MMYSLFSYNAWDNAVDAKQRLVFVAPSSHNLILGALPAREKEREHISTSNATLLLYVCLSVSSLHHHTHTLKTERYLCPPLDGASFYDTS